MKCYKNITTIGVFLIFISLGGYIILSINNKVLQLQEKPVIQNQSPIKHIISPTIKLTPKKYLIQASDYEYKPNIIKVNRDDLVEITLQVDEGYHDLSLDFYNIVFKRLATDKQQTLQFIATQSGTFKYYSTIGDNYQKSMSGKLIVK